MKTRCSRVGKVQLSQIAIELCKQSTISNNFQNLAVAEGSCRSSPGVRYAGAELFWTAQFAFLSPR
jgi:hypothetical protein